MLIIFLQGGRDPRVGKASGSQHQGVILWTNDCLANTNRYKPCMLPVTNLQESQDERAVIKELREALSKTHVIASNQVRSPGSEPGWGVGSKSGKVDGAHTPIMSCRWRPLSGLWRASRRRAVCAPPSGARTRRSCRRRPTISWGSSRRGTASRPRTRSCRSRCGASPLLLRCRRGRIRPGGLR